METQETERSLLMKTFEDVRRNFDALLAKRRVLAALHRSCLGGNIMENTYRGFVAGFHAGADMIEMDTAMTTDGIWYLIHDGMEMRLCGEQKRVTAVTSEEFDRYLYRNTCFVPVGHPERLLETLPTLKGMGLINLDRSWRYWGKGLLEKLAQLDMFDQLLLKCPADSYDALDAIENCGYPFLFMPMVYSAETFFAVEKRHLNLVAAELLFSTEDSEIMSEKFLQHLKKHRVAAWINAITMSNQDDEVNVRWSNISAWHNDDHAVLDGPEANWGWLIDRGADIIQTDWVTMLYCYLRKRFPETRPELFS